MQLKVLLNRVHPLKSFVYGNIRVVEERGRPAIEVMISARANGKAICSGCGRRAPGYDTLPERRFGFIPIWGFLVVFLYAMRRVACKRCGVRVERVPWADGKRQLTSAYCWYLARWARRMSWSEVAVAFHTTWHHVFTSVDSKRSAEGVLR